MFSSLKKNNVRNEYLELLNWLLEDYGYVWLTTRTNLITIQRLILNAIFNAGTGDYEFLKPKDIILGFIQTVLEEEFYLKYHSDFILKEDKNGTLLPEKDQQFNLFLYQEVIRNALYYHTYIQAYSKEMTVFEAVDSFISESIESFPKLSSKEADVYFERSKFMILSKLKSLSQNYTKKYYTINERMSDLNYFFTTAVFHFDKRGNSSFFTYCNLVLHTKYSEELKKVSQDYKFNYSPNILFLDAKQDGFSSYSYSEAGSNQGTPTEDELDSLGVNNVAETEDSKFVNNILSDIFKNLDEEDSFILKYTWGIDCMKLTQKEIADMLGYNQGGISKRMKLLLENIKSQASQESVENILNIIYK